MSQHNVRDAERFEEFPKEKTPWSVEMDHDVAGVWFMFNIARARMNNEDDSNISCGERKRIYENRRKQCTSALGSFYFARKSNEKLTEQMKLIFIYSLKLANK